MKPVSPSAPRRTAASIAARALDALPSQIAVVDADGVVVSVNRAWREAGCAAGGGPSQCREGDNFFESCRLAGDGSDRAVASEVSAALRGVLGGTRPVYEAELPCRAHDDLRWTSVRIVPIATGRRALAAVAFDDITDRKRVELSLVETERVLERAQGIALMGSWSADLVEGTLSASPEAARLAAWVQGPRPLSEFVDRIHPDDREMQRTAWVRALKGAGYDVQHRLVANGDVRWVRVRGEFALGPAGRSTRAFGVIQDVTDQRRISAALTQSQQQKQFALDAAQLGTWYHPPGTTRVRLDARARRLWDVDDTELDVAQLVAGRVHPDDRGLIVGPSAVQGPGRHSIEFRVRHRDGVERWLRLHAQETQASNAEGVLVTASHGTVQDVTERRQVEETAARFVAASPVVIYAFGIVGNRLTVRWFSGNLEAITGWLSEQARDEHWWIDHIHPDDRQRVVDANSLPIPGDHLMQEFRFRRADGTYIWLRDEKRVLRDVDNTPTEIVGSWADITERVALEEQLRQAHKLEAIGLLAGGIAHDFNNLLTVIGGNTDLLMRLLRDAPEPGHLLKQIRGAGERAGELVRQLLAFSRSQVLAPAVVPLNSLVTHASLMLVRLIGEDILFECQLADDAGHVRVDAAQFEQVVLNLAVNARDAMPDGGRLLLRTDRVVLDDAYTRVHPDVVQGSYGRLTVTDTGSGMAPELIARIFEPFFTTKGSSRGTGLGLSMAFGIIKQSGGHIDVSSVPGEGSTFCVYLPQVEPIVEAAPVPGARVDAPAMRRGHETVLIVEDEEIVSTLARVALERSGYQVLSASNGREALELADRYKDEIDLLLSDVVMPEMHGPDLAHALCSRRPGLRVLFMSGYVQDGRERLGVTESHFLAKPFSLKDLSDKVRAVLDASV